MEIPILTAVNDQYVFPLAVMLRSAAEKLPAGTTLSVRLLTRGLLPSNRSRLESSLDQFSVELHEIVIDPTPLYDLRVDGHVSLETYFRLLAPHYLPKYDRVLYLDVDLLVRDSLAGLFCTPFDGAHLLAVPHASKQSGFFGAERGVPSYARLGIPPATRTFNAGVMLLDLEQWRRSSTSDAILRYLRQYSSSVLWWDQDGLNAVLFNCWRPLAARWNVMTSHLAGFTTWSDSLLDEDVFTDVVLNPGIIHYSFVPKPWSKSYVGPFCTEWTVASNATSAAFGALAAHSSVRSRRSKTTDPPLSR